MRGGYKILDFRNYQLTSGEETGIDGMYRKTSNPYGKATMITGLIVGGVEYPDFYAPFISNGGNMTTNVVIGSDTLTITVTPDDNVTVTVS